MSPVRAFLSLGSNLGDRRALLRDAIDSLPDVVAVSPLYETDPVGGPQQESFLNLVAEHFGIHVRVGLRIGVGIVDVIRYLRDHFGAQQVVDEQVRIFRVRRIRRMKEDTGDSTWLTTVRESRKRFETRCFHPILRRGAGAPGLA